MTNTMSLKAQTLNGKAYEFSVYDVPVVIDDEQFILMAKPGSPILLTGTIVSCSDVPNVCEGSILTDRNGVSYVVSFKRGFAAMDAQRNVYKICDIDGLTVTGLMDLSSISLCRQRLIYKCGNNQFQLKDFIGISKGNVIIKEGYASIDISEIQQYAGLTYDGKNVFFGDIIDGSTVVMHAGRVCMFDGVNYIDMTDMQQIK